MDADIRGRMAGNPVAITDQWATNLLRGTGVELRHHGYREAALALFERSIAWLDRIPGSELTRDQHVWKRNCLYDAERWQEAYELARAVEEEWGSGTPAGAAGRSPSIVPSALAAARLGRVEEAEQALRQPWQGIPMWNWGWTVAYDQARIAAVLGQKERALEFLRQVDEPGSLIYAIRTSGDFEILKGDPVFEALLHPRR